MSEPTWDDAVLLAEMAGYVLTRADVNLTISVILHSPENPLLGRSLHMPKGTTQEGVISGAFKLLEEINGDAVLQLLRNPSRRGRGKSKLAQAFTQPPPTNLLKDVWAKALEKKFGGPK